MKRTEAQQWWDELESLARTVGRVGPDEVCCDGLTPRQTLMLRVLVEGEGTRLSDLASVAEISPSALTRNIERLEKAGFVERVRGTQRDAREAIVRVTERGREFRRHLDCEMLERAEALAAAIPAKMRARVLQSLRLLNKAFAAAGCCALNHPVNSQPKQKAHTRQKEDV